jgi:predicted regulator of Ras-like GTPase activity (Roadblock/LC7/MglB family)
MSDLNDILDRFKSDVPNYLSSAVVDMDSGMGMASNAADPDFDASTANAAYTELIKANREALELLDADPHDTDDILITTNGMYLLLREIGTSYYMGVAVSQEGNLALVRKQMESYEEELKDALPNV